MEQTRVLEEGVRTGRVALPGGALPQQLQRGLAGAVDRPVHTAVLLGQRGVGWSLATAGVGLFAVAVASLAVRGLLATAEVGRADALLAFVEASAVLLPACLAAAYLQVSVSPRVLIGAVAVALLQAGALTALLVPLAAFVALVADMGAVADRTPLVAMAMAHLALPTVAVVLLADRLSMVVRSLDPRLRGRLAARAISLCLLFTFAMRLFQVL